MWFNLKNIPCTLDKNVVWQSALSMSVRCNWSVIQVFCFLIDLLCGCSIIESRVSYYTLKVAIYFSCNSVNVWLIYLGVLMSGVCVCVCVYVCVCICHIFIVDWSFYHYIMSFFIFYNNLLFKVYSTLLIFLFLIRYAVELHLVSFSI
jgi:hypothetical protein